MSTLGITLHNKLSDFFVTVLLPGRSQLNCLGSVIGVLRPSYFLRTTLCGCACEVSNPPSVEDTWVMWRELLATYFWASGKAQFQHLKFFKVEALIQILSFRYWLTECVLGILCMLCSQQSVRWDRESPFECHYVRQEHLHPLFLTVV